MSRTKSTPVVFQGLQAGLKMFRWIVLALVVLFLLSGLHSVEQSNVGLLLRFGKLQGVSPAEQVKEPGAVFAFPYPIDELIEVPAKQEGEKEIAEAWHELGQGDTGTINKIDPVLEGYCLTGDQNIVQVKMLAKYRISDPVRYRLAVDEPEQILHEAALAAATQTIAGWKVNDVIQLQRRRGGGGADIERLADSVQREAQRRLDRLDVGVQLTSLEFLERHPPRHVYNDFAGVQDAVAQAKTDQNNAQGEVEAKIPAAQAESNRLVREAEARRSELVSQAKADVSVFEQLYGEYRKNPAVVRRRLLLEAQESLASVAQLRFLAPESRVILPAQEIEAKRNAPQTANVVEN